MAKRKGLRMKRVGWEDQQRQITSHKISKRFWETYFGGDSKENREAAVKRLTNWDKLQTAGIPDSGADLLVMAGEAWITTSIPGENESHQVNGFADASVGVLCPIMKGKTLLMNPDSSPRAILCAEWGAAYPTGRETLLPHLKSDNIISQFYF